MLVDDMEDTQRINCVSIFGRELFIDNKKLLITAINDNFIKHEERKFYTYYHFALENDNNNDARYGVWANGILTETPSINQLFLF